MSKESLNDIGADYHKESGKLWSKLLFFGTILIMSHSLVLKPADFDAGGIKIAIEDTRVIYGGISLVFYYYLFLNYVSTMLGSSLLPMDMNKRLTRYFMSNAIKPFRDEKLRRQRRRSPKEARRFVWWSYFWYNLVVAPCVIVMIGIVLLAMYLGAIDLFNFGEFLLTRLLAE